ncbi:hypothetical protein C7M71_011220 [Peterkaempfera bronchialis]|uniref:Glycosyltransferase RgtA/B/C/D-like domain-containing protein n=1 Tax=Peterkaempfera bronchialis TaxID=2126346 RepID=A0A345SW18_9ACTN|nr:hypothetical protein C7M71_011220 [Peterkaempfera bronchialis]
MGGPPARPRRPAVTRRRDDGPRPLAAGRPGPLAGRGGHLPGGPARLGPDRAAAAPCRRRARPLLPADARRLPALRGKPRRAPAAVGGGHGGGRRGVAVIGRRLAGPAVGLTAGLLLAVTPFASKYAQEGRSYALVTAGVVIATALLLRAWERPTPRRWAGYAAAVLLVGLLHLFALLVLAAHGAAVLTARGPAARRVRRGWVASAASAALCAAPLALFSATQSAQVDWLPPVTGKTPLALLTDFAGPTGTVTAVVLVLAALGLALPVRRPGGPVALRALALPWLVVPPALLMTASLATPLYYDRYVLYSLPGLVLLAAAGLDTAARAAGRLAVGLSRSVRVPGPAAATAAVALLGVGLAGGVLTLEAHRQRIERTSRARVDDFRAAADALRLGARPGDGVVFVPAARRPVEDVYPDAFRGTVDVLRSETPAASGTLSGRQVPVRRIQGLLLGYARVWLLDGLGRHTAVQAPEQEVLRVLHTRYREAGRTAVRGFRVQLWVRR